MNKYYVSQHLVHVSANGHSLSATIPYAVEPGVSAKDAATLQTSTTVINGVYSSKGKPDLSLNISLIRINPNKQIPALRLNPCSPGYCGAGDEATASVGMGEIFVNHFSTRANAAQELLHTFGMWHQWNATKSIMSYAHDRYVHYSDVQRLINAYREPEQ